MPTRGVVNRTGQIFTLLPLDDRPPNFQFPRRLAALGGLKLWLPPRRMLGRFVRPGDAEALWGWLERTAERARAAVVSCDTLAYGGLIASRTTAVPQRLAASRLARLAELKRRFPRLGIRAFAVIPRLGLTVSSPRLAKLGPALARFNELSHRDLVDEREAQELSELRAALPPDLIAAHSAMRERSLAVNKRLVALAAEGALDFLVLAQEDAAITGPHVAEQAELAAEAQRLGAADVVRIHPGADEVGVTLLARAANEHLGATGAVYPFYSTPGGAESVALFEDRPLRMTVAGQVEAAGLRIAPSEDAADIVLALHSPAAAAQTDIGHISPTSAPRPPFVAHLARLASAGKDLALADVAYCNGTDPALISALAGEKVTPRLAGFAGWNTAGNTIGTALAQASLWRLGRAASTAGAAARAQAEFLFERLLDDYAYQSVVRAAAYRFACEDLGEWPLHLRRGRRRALGYVREQLGRAAHRLFAEHLQRREFHGRRIGALRDLLIRLPWPRLFEVEVEARIALE